MVLAQMLASVRHIPAWAPFAAFKRKALEWQKLNRAMLNEPYRMVKERTVRYRSDSPSSELISYTRLVAQLSHASPRQS